MDKFIKNKVKVTCDNLYKSFKKTIFEIPSLRYIPYDYKKPQEIPVFSEDWGTFARFDRVHGKDKHFWFYTKIKTPEKQDSKEYILEIITSREGNWDAKNPQGLLYLNGEIIQGIDINHTTVSLDGDKEYDVLLYFYTGMINSHIEVMMNLNSYDLREKKLYYDLKVPYDAAMCLKEDEYSHIKILKHLEQACNLIDFRDIGSEQYYESIKKADDYIIKEFYEKVCGNSDAVVSYVGHTHIDVAWLWTLSQTKEKVQRSFATVLKLMDKYPEYIFMSSQPQLYEYLKEEEPALYEKVKEKIREGQWEVEGAMWLEADCNLSSGESLIRQIVYGKDFIKKEFGVDSHILWLPDVFGYSAALPQILKKTGVDTFVTSKIAWNELNKMPYDSFMWEGLDGTEIFTYFLTAQNHKSYCNGDFYTTYVGMVNPDMNLGTWERYQQKEYNNETIVTFGYGDGGGGPTEDMLEVHKRLQYGLPGQPKAQMSKASDFLKRVKNNFNKNCEITGRIPKWVGELYLEFHRGTYTSIAKNKKNNRDCELMCQNAEFVSVIDNILTNGVYPTETIYNSWKTILLNQFHDIIPGSSIKEVYDESDRQYEKLRKDIGKVIDEKLTSLAENVSEKGYFVYNPNSFEVSGYAKYNDEILFVKNIPPMGWKIAENEKCDDVIVGENYIESKHYKILFDDNMNIISLYDKDNCRETVKEGRKFNQIKAFEDYPAVFDNWELANYHKQKMWEVNDVSEISKIEGNGFGGFKIVRKYMNSFIAQNIIVYSESRRIDFETKIDWHEHHTVMKAEFASNIHTNKATYETQFGHLERFTHENTSWEKAKFEVCAHKWADLSEEGYGISLLNNCKYGYNSFGSDISLTLLKAGTYPNEEADIGEHIFTYSLYPHADNFKKGGTIKEAYLLNKPLEVRKTQGNGNLPSEYSFISCDCDNIVIETVKQSETKDGIIVRLYESWDKKTKAKFNFAIDAKKIYICDMLENPISEIKSGNNIELDINNFEIITLKIDL